MFEDALSTLDADLSANVTEAVEAFSTGLGRTMIATAVLSLADHRRGRLRVAQARCALPDRILRGRAR
ncbi:MAG TPA: hypothetical protein VIU11_00560 [Nakamurella sp.]